MRRSTLLRFAIFGVLAGTGCGGNGSGDGPGAPLDSGAGGDDTGVVHLDTGTTPDSDGGTGFCQYTIDPTNAVLKIDLTTGTAATQDYKVNKDCSGTVTEVSASETFTVDDSSLGGFGPGAGPGNKTFTTPTSLPTGVLGKTTQVHAQPGALLANVTVIALRVTGDKKDFFFEEPYKAPPSPDKDILKFGTNIKQVDVAFMEDTTASMGGEIANLKASISDTTSGLIAQLAAAIPSVGIAVAHHEDFPVSPFGYDGASGGAKNTPYEVYTTVTTTASKAQSAVNLLNVYFGGDLPEAQYEAMYQYLTGEGFSWTAGAGGSIAAHSPSGANFRAGSLPVVVEITDASWHPSYTAGLTTHTRDEVVDAFNTKAKAKFVGIQAVIEKTPGAGYDTPCTTGATASCDSAQGYVEAKDLAEATGSVVDPAAIDPTCTTDCCTGVGGAHVPPDSAGKCPLVFNAKTDGTGVATGVVKAIQAISVGALFDVTAIPRNDPSNVASDGTPVDAVTSFIKNIRAMDEGSPSEGCPSHAAKDTDGDGVKDTFTGVNVGTPVCFEVNPKQNDTVPAAAAVQFFNAFIDVVGVPGSIKLDTRQVIFLVPPKEPGPAK